MPPGEYAISSFSFTAADFGLEEVVNVQSVAISYTQANAFFTTDGEITFHISFDPIVGAGDYSGLTHNGVAGGVDDSQFADVPSAQAVGTFPYVSGENGTVDTYVLNVAALESALVARLNSGAPFSIIMTAPSGETAATYAGLESNTYENATNLIVTASGNDGGGGEPGDYLFMEDFESDTPGTRPAGWDGDPSENDATNGGVILDGATDPVNPFVGQSMYVYDFSGDGTTGENTRIHYDFSDPMVSAARVEFTFMPGYISDSSENCRESVIPHFNCLNLSIIVYCNCCVTYH